MHSSNRWIWRFAGISALAACVSACSLLPGRAPGPQLSASSATASPSPTQSSSPTPRPTPSTKPDPTSCLSREIINLRVNKDGNDYGFGGEIFVEFQVKFTNNCDQEIKAVEYEARFSDAFKDEIMFCFGKVTVKIPVGESKNSPKDTGCFVGAGEPSYQSWTVVNKADISSEATITRIVFKDGSVSSKNVI